MNLDTQRLILREIKWSDLDQVHKLHSYKEVDEFNTLGIPANRSETRNVMRPVIKDQKKKKRKLYSWAIIEISSRKFIGLAGLTLTADRFNMGEMYYKLEPQSWGKGYATEAARSIVKFGFETLHLHRVEAGVATENVKSIRILEKLGMTCEGTRRKILPIRGVWKDNFHYAIVEDEPREY
ncbi:MAG: GNAT family N-acetyltransferase [Bacteroidales bacterium]|nr:GNAT family N-acetyltransferase [Bacteroidales bacterium]